jgi:hypothetical protein
MSKKNAVTYLLLAVLAVGLSACGGAMGGQGTFRGSGGGATVGSPSDGGKYGA